MMSLVLAFMSQFTDNQKAADKEARRLVRVAYASGGKAPYSLARLIELKFSLKVIRAVLMT